MKKIIYTLEVGILKKKGNYGKNWLKFNIGKINCQMVNVLIQILLVKQLLIHQVIRMK